MEKNPLGRAPTRLCAAQGADFVGVALAALGQVRLLSAFDDVIIIVVGSTRLICLVCLRHGSHTSPSDRPSINNRGTG